MCNTVQYDGKMVKNRIVMDYDGDIMVVII